jgi:glycosyltransferase involved in cell wall biosynthesis
MRVLWLHHRDPRSPVAGGAERLVVEVSSRLSAKGHSVEVIAGESPLLRWCGDFRGFEIRSCPGVLLPRVLGLLRCEINPHPDVIIDDLSHLIPWASPWRRSWKGTALFLHLHARTLKGQVNPLSRPFLQGLERLYPMLYSSWPFVTISEGSKRDLMELGVAPDRVTVIPPGVDTFAFRPSVLTEQPQLIYFSGLRRYKRAEDALRVTRALLQRGISVQLVILGVGPTLPYLRAMSRDFADNVTFLGRVDDSSLYRLLGQSWVNLQCSVSEGWGLTAMEAASSGVPTVAYAVPGTLESVQEEISGVLVPDGDVEAMTEVTARILKTRNAWTKRCREAAEGHSWDEVAKKWESYLTTVSST